MEILDFTPQHIKAAMALVAQNYAEARRSLKVLPDMVTIPDLTPFAENGLGVAAYNDGSMLGFLACGTPFENAFGSTGARGVFSPLHANGAMGSDRAKIYAALYQAAAKKWAAAGATSHAVCLYAHDTAAQAQLFQYGFGLRCVDAIRPMAEIAAKPAEAFTFAELCASQRPQLLPLYRGLIEHFKQSPMFYFPVSGDQVLRQQLAVSSARWFVARRDGAIIAYMAVDAAGESFVSLDGRVMNLCGAFCLPEYRATGVAPALLNHIIKTLNHEGYTYLGVDYESFNPTAAGFWPKYFTAYTSGVVRRIDACP